MPDYKSKQKDLIKIQPEKLRRMMGDIWMAGVNMTDEYQGVWVRYKDIEHIIIKYLGDFYNAV